MSAGNEGRFVRDLESDAEGSYAADVPTEHLSAQPALEATGWSCK